MLALRLPENIIKRLTDLSKKTGRTKTFYAIEAILMHINEIEKDYLELQKLKDARNKRRKLNETEK